MNKKEWQPKLEKVIAKAMTDQAFHQRLLKNPKEALKEHGIELPPNMNFKVLQETKDTMYLILPREKPGKLSPEELKGIAAAILSVTSFD